MSMHSGALVFPVTSAQRSRILYSEVAAKADAPFFIWKFVFTVFQWSVARFFGFRSLIEGDVDNPGTGGVGGLLDALLSLFKVFKEVEDKKPGTSVMAVMALVDVSPMDIDA